MNESDEDNVLKLTESMSDRDWEKAVRKIRNRVDYYREVRMALEQPKSVSVPSIFQRLRTWWSRLCS